MLPVILALLSALPAEGKDAKKDALFVKAGAGAYGTRWRCPSFKAVIDVPPDYERTEPKKNDDIAYQFVMRHKKAAVEVRLQFAARAEQSVAAPSMVWGQVLAMNMNEGYKVRFTAFPPDAVKTEFGADWGFVSEPIVLDPRRGFNKGFTLGMVVVLHRRGVGDLARILLADDFEHLRTLDRRSFYNARFEGAKPPGLVE